MTRPFGSMQPRGEPRENCGFFACLRPPPRPCLWGKRQRQPATRASAAGRLICVRHASRSVRWPSPFPSVALQSRPHDCPAPHLNALAQQHVGTPAPSDGSRKCLQLAHDEPQLDVDFANRPSCGRGDSIDRSRQSSSLSELTVVARCCRRKLLHPARRYFAQTPAC